MIDALTRQEALHTAYILARGVSRFLTEHPAILADERLVGMVEVVEQDLNALYQTLLEEQMDAPLTLGAVRENLDSLRDHKDFDNLKQIRDHIRQILATPNPEWFATRGQPQQP